MAPPRNNRQSSVRNTTFVAGNLAPRLREQIREALAGAPPAVQERLARTALLSRAEAHRYIDQAALGGDLTPEAVTRVHAVIDRLAEATLT